MMLFDVIWMMYGRHDTVHDTDHDTVHDGVHDTVHDVIDVYWMLYRYLGGNLRVDLRG